ncbi:septum formation initiator family protein [Arcanobacterium bovis]|uniref:Septum formation initiator family protein n=1 Tax=Arcanobacterium bovis TaxID=2529275 RepID=A0A4Q9V3Z5_9ACTO|nr:septum formation initiator family protein [Arcanobacterium bovis]TBW23707.1 hypothetical protein EZJ44_00780 [Arcanobacterium bovis]
MSSRPPAPRRSSQSGNDPSARNQRITRPVRGTEAAPAEGGKLAAGARGKETTRGKQPPRDNQATRDTRTRRGESQVQGARPVRAVRPGRGESPMSGGRPVRAERPVRSKQPARAANNGRTPTRGNNDPDASSRTAQTVRARTAQTERARTLETMPETSAATTSAAKRRRSGRDWNVVLSGSERTRQFSVRLALVIAAVMIGVFIVSSPLRGYIAQQEEKRELLSTLDHRKERVQELEQQLALWNDPQYIQSQARQRLGYVLPGQTLYTVDPQAIAGAQPKEQEQLAELNKERRAATPFYMTMWDSISIAGQSGKVDNPSNVPVIDKTK